MSNVLPTTLTAERNLVLIGYRASGKTVVGRELARRLGRPFVDLDDVVTVEAGQSIAALVARQGWGEFRRREKEVVGRYAARPGQVLAPGGGAVLDPDNVAHLRHNGVVVWLTAPPPVIMARLRQDRATLASRPALHGLDPLQEVEEVLAVREPFYRQAAHLTIDTTGLKPEEVADRILQEVRDQIEEAGDGG
ncbi:MAG: shikimate kinase [Deltaproteobacteria bacterium]|nr:shikimate kinase [Deltaproteobacteria bacterium]